MLQIVRQDRTFLMYLATMVVYGLGGVMALPLYPIVQVSHLQLSYTQIGYLGLIQSAFWLAGFAFWGRLLDQRGPIWLLRVAMLLAAVVPFMYSVASNVWLLIPAFVAQGLLQGAFELGATNAGIGLARQGRVLEYTALQTATMGLRGMIAPFIGAALLGAGMPLAWVFVISTVLVLVSFVMLHTLRSPEPESHSGM
jgi:MFS family permease